MGSSFAILILLKGESSNIVALPLLQALGFALRLQACKANGHALLAKSGEKRGKGEREPQLSSISYGPPKSQMHGVTFHFKMG